MRSELPAETAELLASPVQLVQWLEQQQVEGRESFIRSAFAQLLDEAAQPRSMSGKACVRLCGLIDQCAKSSSSELNQWAFSQEVTMQLFQFYLEWNESDNHRSMKLVLDLIARSILKNPDEVERSKVKGHILAELVSVVIGRSTKPVGKSAIQALYHFLTKGVFSLDELRSTYLSIQKDLRIVSNVQVWKQFTANLFHWMRLHFVCPTAGRLIVALYQHWRLEQTTGAVPDADTWNEWLVQFLIEEPALLESIKNYIFLPLFKADRAEALTYLRRMNGEQPVYRAVTMSLDVPALLQLAALETGKKVGLVEEPEFGNINGQTNRGVSITLHEEVLERVLAHPSHEVRSLALSLLVTSPSTTRPYSRAVLELLKSHLAAYFADSDAKFRVDVTAKARDMFRRIRGAIHVLKRSIPRARAKAQKANAPPSVNEDTAQPIRYHSNLISLPESQLEHCLDYHVKFLHWYINFLCRGLIPTASYQRHVTSLKAFMHIIRMEGETSKTWETADDKGLFFDRFDQKWARALMDLIMDPFEDVRDLASAALSKCYADGRYRRLALSDSETESVPVNELIDLAQRAGELARQTARADHSDGASRASQLLYRFLSSNARLQMLSKMVGRLRAQVAMAESDLGGAVIDAPLHGDFAALCHTWQVVSELKHSQSELAEIQKLQVEIVSCCERAWGAVQDVLCDDSPEGHLPPDLDDLEGLDTKNLLSFSFRSVHESSNLMRTIILTLQNRSRQDHIVPSKEVFERIGDLTFSQLSNLRHRGAFTTVSSTFAACCQQSRHLLVDEGQETLLDAWYKSTMNVIHSQASTTRRSAGIPSMITGILSANAARPSFEQVMAKLMDIASKEAKVSETDGSNLPQVHAFNCLKDIFKNSLLASIGNKSELYLPQCLGLAAKGLRSEVWAIRNCGLIFLRSLIDNLFGTHESKASIETGWDGKANGIHYHRYPSLPVVLRNLLQSGHRILAKASNAGSAAESVFPALDIIRRAGPPDLLRDEIQGLVAAYLSSPVWHVRDMAARTLCSCLLHDKWLVSIKDISRVALSGAPRGKENHVHGVLLTMKYVIEKLGSAHAHLLGDLETLHDFLTKSKIDVLFAHCHDALAAYLDVINTIWTTETKHNMQLHAVEVHLPAQISSALLKIRKAIYEVYVTSRSNGNHALQLQDLLQHQQIGQDGLVAALEAIPTVWPPDRCSADELVSWCRLYAETCSQTSHVEAQVVALENLTTILDELLPLCEGSVDRVPSDALLALWQDLTTRDLTPALANAVIRASGCIVASVSPSSINVDDWGAMMAAAALDDKTFDTRFAAASSLRSFFAVHPPLHHRPQHLAALLSVYDALNDDDDEVRDVAAAAAQHIIGLALVPLEAATRLLDYLVATFGDAPAFKTIVADRLIGHCGPGATTAAAAAAVTGAQRRWAPADEALSKALQFDDSLFVVEEQNLFVDPVREAQRWVQVFEALEWRSGGDHAAVEDAHLIKLLTSWVKPGLERLKQLLQVKDGPLGWASNPAVLAVCSRLLHISTALCHKTDSPALVDWELILAPQSHHLIRLLSEI